MVVVVEAGGGVENHPLHPHGCGAHQEKEEEGQEGEEEEEEGEGQGRVLELCLDLALFSRRKCRVSVPPTSPGN